MERSFRGDICPGESISRGEYLSGGEGKGLCPGGSLSRGSLCLLKSLSRVSLSERFPVW